MKSSYQMQTEKLLKKYQVTLDGLSETEAERKLREYGKNTLNETKRKSTIAIFFQQFCDLLVIILIVAAMISMFSGNIESTVVILAVIILNAVLGTVQYVKARKSLDALKAMSSLHARVVRNGQQMEISSDMVVPGDILHVEAGDMVAADARILQNHSLQVNESSLTGESTNIEKADITIEEEVPLAERYNMVYSGSLVTYGRAVALVTDTGMTTQIGKIAELMNSTEEKKTPLQVSLDQFGSKLAMIIMAICVIVFALSMYRKMPLLDSMMFAVALAVAAIPEALGSIVTIVQAMGTQKMAVENAIIKDLKAVESLGCVSVICSDKTGTLTQNKMTVQEVYRNDQIVDPSELNCAHAVDRYMVYNAILNNDASIQDGSGIGDPTEYCLLEMAEGSGVLSDNDTVSDIRVKMQRLQELPFDSDRKLMSSRYHFFEESVVFTKGAVDVLLKRITHIQKDDGIHSITSEDIHKISDMNNEFSSRGLRVLAFAYRRLDENVDLTHDQECDFTFLGLISMMDPPRIESKQAVADAKRAGIRPVMITGDHKVTATAIAKTIGLYEDGDIAVTGLELDAMGDEELERKLETISVYARVSPENKIRIVKAWQNKFHITAMTGDGVNDAPALKQAEIGIAMGINGTEVSKDAASMILMDDNFATIIKAVQNGRNVYRNIQNAIKFLLSGNMAGIFAVLYCSLMGLPAPFAPVHLLFINLLTDALPALAIGMEPADQTLIRERPRDPRAGILSRRLMSHIILQGALIASVTITAFYIGMKQGSAVGSTMAFAVLTFARLLHGFNCRSPKPLCRVGVSSNMWCVYAFLIGSALLSLVLFCPLLQKLFVVASLSWPLFFYVVLLGIIPFLAIQLIKVKKC